MGFIFYLRNPKIKLRMGLQEQVMEQMKAAMKAKPGDDTIPFEAFAYCTMQVTRLAREYDMRKFHGK